MKTITTLILSTASLVISSSLNAQLPRNCSEIHFVTPSAPSGVYTIDPDGSGPKPAMSCQCDMTTDGGGWTLVLNYMHQQNTSPDLRIMNDSLPLQGSTTLGGNEFGTAYWGHADTSTMNALHFDEVRFYGISSGHSRILHFKTSHAGTVSYFKTGIGSTLGISSNFTALTGHTAFLPAAIDMTVYDQGNYAMTNYPLWTGATYHWYLNGSDPNCINRWEVDDYPCNTPSTFHQIWVRQNVGLGMQSIQMQHWNMQISPNPISDYTVIKLENLQNTTATDAEIKIYNVLGDEIQANFQIAGDAFILNKGHLNSGVYFVRLFINGVCRDTEKLIIE
ncbi:MAG: hypothetical protein Fur0041_19630 [Bacteroidia bacterium]